MHTETALKPAPSPTPPAAATAEVTQLLDAWSAGDRAALDRLIPAVVDDLRRLARSFMASQAPGHTLQPTALVSEAYLRLVGRRPAPWESRSHFFAYVATAMRRILVSHARSRQAAKRGNGAIRVAFDDSFDAPEGSRDGGDALLTEVDLLDLDRALRSLAELDPRQSRIVEMRYFGGLSVAETAQALDVSQRTVKREWHTARLWLLRALSA